MPAFRLQAVAEADRERLALLVAERWGASFVVSRGRILHPADLPGFVAEDEAGTLIGLVTFRVQDDQCEVVTLDSLREGQGVGRALLGAVLDHARSERCRRVWLVTTNDNQRAIQFYERQGFVQVALHRGAVDRARALKPCIPETAADGTRIRDELEFEIRLADGGGSHLHRLLCVALLLPGCAAVRPPEAAPAWNAVPLVTTREDGVVDSQVVPIRLDGRDVWLALDTAGVIRIGCEEWTVPGYRDEAIGVEVFRGRPILGVLGLDFFLGVPAEIDYPGGRVVRHLDGVLARADRCLPGLPLRGGEDGRALVDVWLDGQTRTLMFDTGAHDTIPVGGADGWGAAAGEVQTADGRRWEVRVGNAACGLPGEKPRLVPVLRAAELAYIAPELRAHSAEGLLGLTTLGWRRIVLDFGAGVLRLGPRAY